MPKVRFYCSIPKHGVLRGQWPLTAWTDIKSVFNSELNKVLAFDVDFPPELVREPDVAPAAFVGVTEVRSDG